MELVLERSVLAAMGVSVYKRAPFVNRSMSGVTILSLFVPRRGVVRSEQSPSRARAGHDFGEDCPARFFIQRCELLGGAPGLRRGETLSWLAGTRKRCPCNCAVSVSDSAIEPSARTPRCSTMSSDATVSFQRRISSVSTSSALVNGTAGALDDALG